MSSAGSYGGSGGGGGVGNVKFLTGNSGGPVPPDLVGNINVVGTGALTVVGNAGTNTLTIELSGTVATTYDADTGSATPAAGILNINGLGGIATSASGHTIDIGTDGSLATEYSTDSGIAVPSADILNIVGGTGIATSGSGNTVTITSTATGVTSIQGDTGGPISGALTITGGGTGLLFDTSGSPDILLEADFLSLPDTNNILTTGYIAIGGAPVLAMCGGVANSNVCVGPVAGTAGMTGIQNICIGAGSLSHGSNSVSNTVSIGTLSCQNLATGSENISIGTDALNSATSSTGNTVIGYGAATGLLTGTDNIVIGVSAGGNYTSSESGNIVIGANGITSESDALHIGSGLTAAYISGIYSEAVGGTNALVFIDNTGKLGTTGGTFSAVTSITGDAGGSITGAVTVTGGSSGAFYTGSGGNTLTTTFTKLNMPFTNIAGTQGVIQFGGANVLGFYGGVGENNVLLGDGAGAAAMSGSKNTGVGSQALNGITSGADNTALGYNALNALTTGGNNTALGEASLFNLVTGQNNIAIGNGSAATYTTSESSNIVIGSTGTIADANQIRIGSQGSGGGQQNKCNIAGIFGSTVGGTNSAVFIDNAGNLGTVGGSAGGVTSITGNSGGALTGALTLTGGTSGGTFTGSGTTLTMSFTSLSLPDTNAGGTNGVIKVNSSNVLAFYGGTSSANVLVGPLTGLNTMSGSHNIVVGNNALKAATSCNDNVAVGFRACQALTSGSSNIGIGTSSLGNASATTANQNVSIGHIALSGLLTGASNIAIGFQAGLNYTSSESSNILIGHAGVAAESNVIRIGDGATQTSFFTTGVAGVTVTSTAAVLVNTSTGQLGTIISSRRFKENIDDMGAMSRDIHKLRPVKFNFKGDYTENYGLIAEDVEEIMPHLVSYDKEGLPCTVKYHELPVFLLNEIQRLKLKIDELEGKLNARVR